MNHLYIETNLSDKMVNKIINSYLDSKGSMTIYDIIKLRAYFKESNYKSLKETCYKISGNISRTYGSKDYLTNCLYMKIDNRDAIQITIPIAKEIWTKIILYAVKDKEWNIDINIPIDNEANLILGRILAYLTFKQKLGKEKIRLDHKETTVGIGLATLSMIVSDNMSEAKILEDMGLDLYYS